MKHRDVRGLCADLRSLKSSQKYQPVCNGSFTYTETGTGSEPSLGGFPPD